MKLSQSVTTALLTVGLIFMINQFEETRKAFSGGNKYFR